MEVRTGMGPGRKPNLVFAIFMIVAGILLFLANLGFLPIHNVWDYWPLVFVAVGLGKIASCRRHGALVAGVMFIVLGFVFTLINIGVFKLHMNDGSWPLSLVFLAIGIAGLSRVLDGEGSRRQKRRFAGMAAGNPAPQPSQPWPTTENWQGWSQSGKPDDSPAINNLAFMASVNRKVESLRFQGGSLTAMLGSIDVDLRRSTFPEGVNMIAIDTNAILGSVKLRIPESWRVAWNGIAILGNFEDKTVPPNTGSAAPTLILTGYAVMGSIEVES